MILASTLVVLYDPLWSCLVLMVMYGPLCLLIVSHGPFWSLKPCFVPYGPVRTHKVLYGPVYMVHSMVPFGPLCSILPYYQVWPQLPQFGPDLPCMALWSLMVHNVPVWSHMVPYATVQWSCKVR